MAPQIKTEQEMFPLVEGWHESGLTQKQFCATHQIPVHILAYWVGRYRKSQLEHNTPSTKARKATAVATKSNAYEKTIARDTTAGFIRLTPPSQASAPTPTGSMEIVLPTGVIIRFSTTVPAAYLKEVLSVCSH